MVFDNDTCLVEYSAMKVIDPLTGKTELSHENLQKSLNEIRRFSERDADTAEELFRRYTKTWKSAMAEYRFSPPVPWGEKNALEKLCDDPKDGIDPVYQFMTSQQLAYDLFDSEELRTLFIRASMTSFGGAPDDVIGLHGLIHSIRGMPAKTRCSARGGCVGRRGPPATPDSTVPAGAIQRLFSHPPP